MPLTESELKQVRNLFKVASWRFESVTWYWLPKGRRTIFRCEGDVPRAHPVPLGAHLIGHYTKQHYKDFLDDLDDIIALCERTAA